MEKIKAMFQSTKQFCFAKPCGLWSPRQCTLQHIQIQVLRRSSEARTADLGCNPQGSRDQSIFRDTHPGLAQRFYIPAWTTHNFWKDEIPAWITHITSGPSHEQPACFLIPSYFFLFRYVLLLKSCELPANPPKNRSIHSPFLNECV